MEQPHKQQIVSPVRSRTCHDVLILGYIIESSFLNHYRKKHKLGQQPHTNNKYQALKHILCSAGLFWQAKINVTLVKVDGELQTRACIAIANNASAAGMKLPPAEKIEKLQRALETTEPPQWYIKY